MRVWGWGGDEEGVMDEGQHIRRQAGRHDLRSGDDVRHD